MKTSEDKITHPCLGKIRIGVFQSNGTAFFAGGKDDTSGVSIELSRGYYYPKDDNLGKNNHLFGGQDLYRIQMSSNQWAMSLRNINSEIGVPVTINSSYTGISYKEFMAKVDADDYENVSNSFSNVSNKFKKTIQEFLPELSVMHKELYSIISSEKADINQRKRAKHLVREMKQYLVDNKSNVGDLLEKHLFDLHEVATSEFIENVRTNFLNFTASNSLIEAQEALKLVMGEKKYKSLPSTLSSEELNKTLPKERFEGVLVIKEIVRKNGYVEDVETTNGYSFSLHQAEVSYTDGVKVIKPAELLTRFEMSVNQFNTFICSFNQGENPLTLSYTETDKDINVDEYIVKSNFDNAVENFYDGMDKEIDRFDMLIDMLDEEFNSSKTSAKKRELFRVHFDGLDNRILGTHAFFFKDIVSQKEAITICKYSDIIETIKKGIQQYGVNHFAEELKNAENKGEVVLKLFQANNPYLLEDNSDK